MDQFVQYATNHPFLLGFAVVMLIAVIVTELRVRNANFAALGPQDVVRAMNQGAVVLDLRKPEQFAAGHIHGARLVDPGQILKANETLKKFKDKTVIVYCENGSLGASAARELIRHGFTKAQNLRGGLAAWRAENLPLVKGHGGKDGKSS
ncbi:MAG: rhodanese-like domain-containing protein [Steroidobacteraceae bacterium]|nr:rhodanese-like domain-containing protein [Steroidobacteraceae bacterium]MDW8259913.1 rhodanese-like domain-containing protein [Gammaproteobacteria bacterium]